MFAVLRAAWLLLLQQGIQIPPPTGLVNDFAHVLQPEAVQRMERIAEDVRTKSRGEIAVVTLADIGNRDVQEVSLQIGRQWKVGKIGNPGEWVGFENFAYLVTDEVVQLALFNTLFVGTFNALPRSMVRRFGWHLLAFCEV